MVEIEVPDTQPEPTGSKDNYWKRLLNTILGTTISILLTFGTNSLIQQHRKVKDRKMTALMVMSNIESFARTLEAHSDRMASADSIAAWLLCTPYEDLELLPEKELSDLIDQAFQLATLNQDHTAENIFSNSIETWKNVENVQFINNVGACFSAINGVEEQFNQWVNEVVDAQHDIKVNPNNYEGNTIEMKIMHSNRIRTVMTGIHAHRGWLRYAAACLRYFNLQNMVAINITEQQVFDYLDACESKVEKTGTVPNSQSFYTDAYTLDSLTSLTHLTERIEELKAEKE